MKTLTEQQILDNTNRFKELIRSIEREGSNIELLIKQLESTDFFQAPASTKYHGAYRGGLCEHCLNVYDNLVRLVDVFGTSDDVDEDSLKIVALLHDFSKMSYYTIDIKNRKVYSENGSKQDSMGRFDWESYESYTIRDPKDRLCISNHESTAAFMANSFIPLTFEEYAAIENHHAGSNWDSANDMWMSVFESYNLAVMLHIANLIDIFNKDNR